LKKNITLLYGFSFFDQDRPQHDLGRRCGAPLSEARGANGDDGERAAGGRGCHPLLWASAVGEPILSWIPVLLALRLTEPPAALDRGKTRVDELKEILSTTLVRDAATRTRPSLSTLGVLFFDISDRSESRSVTGLVGGSSWPSAGDLTA